MVDDPRLERPRSFSHLFAYRPESQDSQCLVLKLPNSLDHRPELIDREIRLEASPVGIFDLLQGPQDHHEGVLRHRDGVPPRVVRDGYPQLIDRVQVARAAAGDTVQTIITLDVASGIPGITDFSFNIVIEGTA